MNDGRVREGSFADMIFEQAKAHQECYIAGVRAADANSPSARRLARLIDQVEAALYEHGGHISRETLRAALDEARGR